MAINTLATATLFMTQLDKIAVQEATTGWMDANAGQVIYNGGSEVKIPKMSVQGMGDYDREAGYQRGSVTLEYETRKMTQDRTQGGYIISGLFNGMKAGLPAVLSWIAKLPGRTKEKQFQMEIC